MPSIQEVLFGYVQSGQTQSRGDIEGNNVLPKGPVSWGSNKYDFRYRTFPLDLGMEQNKHYIVFNINVPVDSTGTVRGSTANNGASFADITNTGQLSKVDQLRFGNLGTLENFMENGGNTGLPRFTKRIAESIALHMPTPLVYTSTNVYDDISLTSIAGQAGKLAGTTIGKALGAMIGAGVSRSVAGGIAGGGIGGSLVGAVGNVFGAGFQLAGHPINPRIEVMFANTLQRQFAFEFLMAPRNEEESIVMDNIIRTFKFHGAPAIDSADFGSISQNQSWIGRVIDNVAEASKWAIPFYIPPAEFDITFFNNGVENTNIPRVNTCVLERIEVDYQPTGAYATFSNGYPVAARLSMAFRETEVVHKTRVLEGF